MSSLGLKNACVFIIYSHIDSLFTSERKTNGYAISMSIYLDNTRWNTHHPTYNSFTNRPAWIKRRIPWLDAEIQKLPGVN